MRVSSVNEANIRPIKPSVFATPRRTPSLRAYSASLISPISNRARSARASGFSRKRRLRRPCSNPSARQNASKHSQMLFVRTPPKSTIRARGPARCFSSLSARAISDLAEAGASEAEDALMPSGVGLVVIEAAPTLLAQISSIHHLAEKRWSGIPGILELLVHHLGNVEDGIEADVVNQGDRSDGDAGSEH